MDRELNYFALFGLVEDFHLDLDLLSQHYRALQKEMHPDRFAHAGEREQLRAVQQTAHLNDALATLKSPLKRAAYLLTLKGIELDHPSGRTMAPLFLMEQMELRESLEQARHADDPEVELERLQAKVEGDWDGLIEEFVQLLNRADPASLGQAADSVRKLQFLDKLRQEIEHLEDELTDY